MSDEAVTPRPFDPDDPFDAMADSFRKQIVGMVMKAEQDEAFAALPDHRRLECFMAGVVTGLLGVCFSCIKPDGRDTMVKAIVAYVLQAREHVEAMLEDETKETVN